MAHSKLERALRRDRRVVVASLMFVTAVAWAYTFAGVSTPPMDTGAAEFSDLQHGMMLMPMAWTPSHAMFMLLMWWIMMIAMMVPAAAATILLFAAISRRNHQQRDPFLPTAVFLAGYLMMWAAFSLVATGVQWTLDSSGLLTAMAIPNTMIGGSMIVAVGLYQLTPMKKACLRHCRGPVRFLTEHWRPGASGAWRMGAAHGAYCLGCCWFLMALLFVGGVMNVLWIAGLAVYVLFEKTVSAGHWLSRAAGIILVLAGTSMLASTEAWW
jgi:predicted metal-binding membrane protein